MILSSYNFHIGRTNGSLFCDLMWPVGKNMRTMTAQCFYIPVHGQITNHFLYGIVQNNAALFAGIQSEYNDSTEIQILLYTPIHEGYTRYKAKTLGQFILFLEIVMAASEIVDE
ncbi:unnamed protein product [Adineta ricciae]|uniref:Uncharacterized protein n=2 Tax=Adineta ricciae TaxID=249248 RepID=A0A815KER3_ADIRI|nr:unnamed protein product [Adineta ricciae]